MKYSDDSSHYEAKSAFISSMLTIEKLEQGVKYVQS